MIRLSVCLIARNEEQNLPRALQSVTGIADEIVITDTGSVDGTARIAESFGARVYHFPWCDDFSAALNFTFGHARGQWILHLDADEELLSSSREGLKDCLESEGVLAYLVTRQDLARADNIDLYTEMWQLRLFRRLPELRLRGRCHADFFPPLPDTAKELGMEVAPSEVTIRHYGYVNELLPGKLARAARLLQMELADRPRQFYYLVEYGRTLLALGDPKGKEVMREAAKRLAADLDSPIPPSVMSAPLMEYLLQLPEDQLPYPFTRKRLREVSRRWFPKAPPLLWIMARQDFDEGLFKDAAGTMYALLEMGKNRTYDRTISFDPAIVGDAAALNLGACLIRLGKLNEAEKLFQGLLAAKTHAREARLNLGTIDHLRRQFSLPRTRRAKKR